MGGDPLLRLDGVRFSYPGRMVFADLDLSLSAGQHMVIAGPSGCGKSTLLHLIAGLLRPQAGRIRCNGRDVAGPDCERALVFQDLALFPWYSALGNVAYGLARQGVARRDRERRAMDLLSRMGISAAEARRHPHALSVGQRQRVALARAAITAPRLLLLDEPSAALDHATAMLVQDELQRMRSASGAACITVTHRVDEAMHGADRRVVLDGHPARCASEDDPRPVGRYGPLPPPSETV